MKIARVEAVPVRLPFVQVGPPIMAFGRPFTAIELLLVVVETEDGIVGYGEVPFGSWRPVKVILDEFLAPAIVGREVANIGRFMRDLQRVAYVLGRYGLTMFALSALDTALWDIAGKAAGLPLYRLLGGSGGPVPGYATLWVPQKKKRAWDWESTDPEALADCVRAAVDSGYRYVKHHGTMEADLRTIQDAAGEDVRVMVDASCRWSYSEAREAALRLRPYDLYWLEEPIFPPEDFSSLARLQAETGAAVAAGEHACTAFEFAAMFEKRAVTFAQPSVTKVGGVTEFQKVAALAETHGVELCAHSVSFGPGFLATLHLMAAQPRAGLVEKAAIPLEVNLYATAIEPKDGRFSPPEGPGLGCDPDPDVLKEFEIRDA